MLKHVILLHDLDPSEARRALQRLQRLREVLVLHNVEELADEALEEALRHRVTFYDALYIVLAKQLNTPLYTYNSKLTSKLRDKNTGTRILPNC